MKWNPVSQNEITTHPNWLSTLVHENVTIHLIYNGNPVRMLLFWNDELIFNYEEYNPRFSQDKATLDVMVDAIFWLTLGENEGEITEEYNEKQIEWLRSVECEELKYLAQDFENNDSDYTNDAKIELNACFHHC